MMGWDWVISCDDLPLVVDASGYSCPSCAIICLDWDRSNFDYYVVDGETRENTALFQAKVDAGYFDWNNSNN